ncbi:hypothetical protein MY11210_006552 [Beauveria gryllotalpidicola]
MEPNTPNIKTECVPHSEATVTGLSDIRFPCTLEVKIHLLKSKERNMNSESPPPVGQELDDDS